MSEEKGPVYARNIPSRLLDGGRGERKLIEERNSLPLAK
jgi:hypothetical protein